MGDAGERTQGRVDLERLVAFAWDVIAFAGNRDWTKETKDWRSAARRFRTEYFAYIDQRER